MRTSKYKNIKLTNKVEEANCITHSGKFHVDDVISTVFLSKIIDNVILVRVPTIANISLKDKIVYDIGLGKFDHHQKNWNGQRENGIYYSSIGLLWKELGKEYLRKLEVKNIDKTFEYMDKELIQYIDAADNMQTEYVKNKILPDFIKLCNPKWNENISENEAFLKAVKLADDFWEVYIKNAIAEVEGIDVVLGEIEKCIKCYLVFDREMPYKKAIELTDNNTVKYMIFKSRREGYEIRIIKDLYKFKDEIVLAKDLDTARKITGVSELIYIDNRGRLCCTETLESAIKLVEYNEDNG